MTEGDGFRSIMDGLTIDDVRHSIAKENLPERIDGCPGFVATAFAEDNAYDVEFYKFARDFLRRTRFAECELTRGRADRAGRELKLRDRLSGRWDAAIRQPRFTSASQQAEASQTC